MKVESVNFAERQLLKSVPADDSRDIEERAAKEETPSSEALDQKLVHGEELLEKIKSLTDEGTYSVRFEMNDTLGKMIVRVVDPENDEVIRQLPAEEILGMMEMMHELRGQIVDSAT